MLNPLHRRRFVSGLVAACGAGCGASWLSLLAAEQAGGGNPSKRIVLLWLNGGPATIDLWDLKPRHENGGPFREIQTRTPGWRISEHLPRIAEWTGDMALIRTLSSREGDHDRASHLARTGYKPQAGIDFPHLGALVAQDRHRPDALLPNFVSIAPPRPHFASHGFLDPVCAPMHVGEQARTVRDLTVKDLFASGVRPEDAEQRAKLLGAFNRDFVQQHPDKLAASYAATSRRAVRTMHPSAARAFELDMEPAKVRERYGENLFGQGCLLARRLVERGVSFVEVTLDGWDTHADNFRRVADLSGRLDAGFAALTADLRDRGLLASTLIVCMGEFGRTPKINAATGRDHWPRVWSAVVVGGGVGRGQVIGRTSRDGTEVKSEPHSVPDLIATICRAAHIDYTKQNDSNVGRPIRIADPSANPIEELL